MKALDTTYITLRDGTAIWLSPEASASRETLEALLKEAASSEIRRVIRAGEGLTLMLGGEPLGQQAWLKEGMREEDITEGVFQEEEEQEEELPGELPEAVIEVDE